MKRRRRWSWRKRWRRKMRSRRRRRMTRRRKKRWERRKRRGSEFDSFSVTLKFFLTKVMVQTITELIASQAYSF